MKQFSKIFPFFSAFALLGAIGIGVGAARIASQVSGVSLSESRAAEPPRRAFKFREADPAAKFFEARRMFQRAATNDVPFGENAVASENETDCASAKTLEIPTASAKTRRAAGAFQLAPSGSVATGFEFEFELELNSDEFPIVAGPNAASAGELPVACSAWGRFAPGSWARYRTTSVAYENGKTSQSVTESKLTLKKIDYERKFYELQADGTIKMGGVDRPRASETLRFDFWDVPFDDKNKVETLAPINLLIAGKAIPCQTRRVTRTTPNWTETTTLWFSSVVAPYVLQKETTRDNLATNEKNSAAASPLFREISVVQKTAANLLLGRNFSSYVVASSARNGRNLHSKTTERSTDAPGGLVRETIVQTNEKGVVLYRSTTVLLDYYVAP